MRALTFHRIAPVGCLFLALLLAACEPEAAPLTTTPPTATMMVPAATGTPTRMPGSPTPVVALKKPEATSEGILSDPSDQMDQLYRLPAGADLSLVGVDMLDRLNGWAFGGDRRLGKLGHVLLTADGGTRWKDVSPPEMEPVLGEGLTAFGDFANAKIGWVVFSLPAPYPIPAYPTVWRTADGGATWAFSEPLPTDGLRGYLRITHLEFTGEKFGWILAHSADSAGDDRPVLFRTGDSGKTWARVVDPQSPDTSPCRVTGMLLQDSMQGWLTGDCGDASAQPFLLRTVDGGATWARIPLLPPPAQPDLFDGSTRWCEITSSARNGSAAVFVLVCHPRAGGSEPQAAYLYSSADRGISWTIRAFPGGRILYAENPGIRAWALGRDLYWTDDGGSSWRPLAHLGWDGAFDFINHLEGWAVGSLPDRTGLFRTIDGGTQWEELSLSTIQP